MCLQIKSSSSSLFFLSPFLSFRSILIFITMFMSHPHTYIWGSSPFLLFFPSHLDLLYLLQASLISPSTPCTISHSIVIFSCIPELFMEMHAMIKLITLLRMMKLLMMIIKLLRMRKLLRIIKLLRMIRLLKMRCKFTC